MKDVLSGSGEDGGPGQPRAGIAQGGRRLAVLDRPGRDLHGRGRTPPGRRPRHPQAPLRPPGALPGRSRPGDPGRARPCIRRADPGGRCGEDGDHRRHQRAARTQGGPYPARRQPRFPGRAPHRLPGPAAPVRPRRRASRDALRAGGRGGRTGRGRRRSARAARSRRRGDGHGGGARGRDPVGRHRAHARLPLPGTRARPRPGGARDRVHPGVDELRDEPAHEAGRARRHHRGRRLPLAAAAPLRRRGRGGVGRRGAPHVHAVERRAHGCPAVPGQGRDPVRPRGRHRGGGGDRGARRARTHHLVRHGRDLHRRRPLRRGPTSARSRPWWRGYGCAPR